MCEAEGGNGGHPGSGRAADDVKKVVVGGGQHGDGPADPFDIVAIRLPHISQLPALAATQPTSLLATECSSPISRQRALDVAVAPAATNATWVASILPRTETTRLACEPVRF